MTRKLIAPCFFALLVCCAVAFGPSTSHADMTPTQTLQKGVNELIDILKDPVVNTEEGRQAAIEKLSNMADDYFSFEQISMRSVGRPWLKMSRKDKDSFISSFRRLLELTYLQKIRQYDDESVEYQKELVKGERAMVLTQVSAADKVYAVNYKMINLDGRWMVYDVIAEGISLVKNYRSQFDEILQKGTIGDLIGRLNQKISKLEASKDSPEGEGNEGK